jgi:hypothetical protein
MPNGKKKEEEEDEGMPDWQKWLIGFGVVALIVIVIGIIVASSSESSGSSESSESSGNPGNTRRKVVELTGQQNRLLRGQYKLNKRFNRIADQMNK